jgi:hypothetical protein
VLRGVDGSLSSSGQTAGSSRVEKYATELNKFLAKVHMRLTKGTEVVSVRPFHLSSANRFRSNLFLDLTNDIYTVSQSSFGSYWAYCCKSCFTRSLAYQVTRIRHHEYA